MWMNNSRIRLRFERSCLKQEDTTPFTLSNVVSVFIVYELDSCLSDLNTEFTLGGSLFGCVKLTKNADPGRYSYSGYGSGFDTRGYHSLPDSNVGKNAIIFGVDMSSSACIDNEGKDISILGKGATHGLNRTLTANSTFN